MNKKIWVMVFVAWFCILYGCGTDTDSEKAWLEKAPTEKARIEKERIEKVSDAASKFGYDGESIEKGSSEIDDLTNDRDEAADDIFDE